MLKNTLEKAVLKKCDIEIFGLGYVGFPLAVKLASFGFKVYGIDKNQQRIERLKNQNLMETELNMKLEFAENMKCGNLILNTGSVKTNNTKIGIICVPTPIKSKDVNSNVFVMSVLENFLDNSKNGDIIIIESSIEIGTTEQIKNTIEKRGFIVGQDLGLIYCPERIDPQNSKWRLENIPRVIYCSDDTTFEIAKQIYHYINNSNLKRVSSPRIAEVVKSFENAFRLVNISLVNELAILCDKLKINVSEVIEAASTKPFGFMPFYPSAGAGGHCIPKDPRFLLSSAKNFGLDFKTIENALRINDFMPEYICQRVNEIISNLKLGKKVLVCGLSYKPDIEDMRDSSGFKIAAKFQDMGFEVSAYDPYFKSENTEKYVIENNIEKLNFEIKSQISMEYVKKFSCICVVQNHTKSKYLLEEIYEKSLVPAIFDCQGRIERKMESKSALYTLGS